MEPWAAAVRDLVAIGKPAVPALIAELDRTTDPMALRSLGFTRGDSRVAIAWQATLIAIVGLVIEHSDWPAVTKLGWLLIVYSTVIQFCVAYVAWFAALSRLPASVAAIGTMAVPVIGVVASAIALHEPLGPGQIAALVFTLAGVVLATRS